MKKRQLSEAWMSLRSLFRSLSATTPEQIISALNSLSIDSELIFALKHAVLGDNHLINQWLFSRPVLYDQPLAWIAPVLLAEQKNFVWMIGFKNSSFQALEQKFRDASSAFCLDHLLLQRQVPEPLLFIDPVEIASLPDSDQQNQDEKSEFAIFQTAYEGTSAEVTDFDQRMVINADYAIRFRLKVIQRAKSLFESDQVLTVIQSNIELFSLLHIEGHNRAHFLGPWPFDENKNCVLYEVLEEYRSCALVVRLAEHMGFSEEELDALAVCIFLVRFLGYGYDAYCATSPKKETVREISVGLIFFTVLLEKGAIEIINSPKTSIRIHSTLFRTALIGSVLDIHKVEEEALEIGVTHLKDYARSWYSRIFPGQSYRPEVVAVYDHLLNLGEST